MGQLTVDIEVKFQGVGDTENFDHPFVNSTITKRTGGKGEYLSGNSTTADTGTMTSGIKAMYVRNISSASSEDLFVLFSGQSSVSTAAYIKVPSGRSCYFEVANPSRSIKFLSAGSGITFRYTAYGI